MKHDVKNIQLNGNILPWVKDVKHLWCTLQSDNSMTMDINQKRGQFIGKVNSLLQEFHSATPKTLMTFVNTYATSMYGSSTWDIFSAKCEKIYTAWNVAVRQILRLDRKTHRSLIEPLSGCRHMKVMLSSRYAGFYNSLCTSKKSTVRFLVRLSESDKRTVLGRTLSQLLKNCMLKANQLDKLCPGLVKRSCFYWPNQEDSIWQEDIAIELIHTRECTLEVPGFSNNEIDEMLDYVCTSWKL